MHVLPQVRAVASPIDTLVLSASRDTTAVSWTRPSSTEPFVQSSTFRAGSRYVNAIAYIPPTPDAPKGTFDALLRPWTLQLIDDFTWRRFRGHWRTRRRHKRLSNRFNSRGACLFTAGAYGECLCFGRYGKWSDCIWVLGQVRCSCVSGCESADLCS